MGNWEWQATPNGETLSRRAVIDPAVAACLDLRGGVAPCPLRRDPELACPPPALRRLAGPSRVFSDPLGPPESLPIRHAPEQSGCKSILSIASSISVDVH